MIPGIPLTPNCLALRFQIYRNNTDSDKRFQIHYETDLNTLTGVPGYCLIIFEDYKLYYVKRTVNLKTYITNVRTGINSDSSVLPQCLQNVLKKPRVREPVVYFLIDNMEETLQQIHNMLSPYNWTNMITKRGDRINNLRLTYKVRFSHDLEAIVSVDPSAGFSKHEISKRALDSLKKRLVKMKSRRLMERVVYRYNCDTLENFISLIWVMDIFDCSHLQSLNMVATTVSKYNDNAVINWVNRPVF